jgi:Ran GTPase-activating protein (RanGAP) involved in mRNA processing and transport
MEDAGKVLGAALAVNTVLKQLDLSKNYFNDHHAPRFAKELVIGLRDNETMTSLNLSDNFLGPEGGKHIAEGIKVSKCVVAVVLVPFSSDI